MSVIKIDNSKESIDKFFDRKLDRIYPTDQDLRKELASGRRLRFYMGADVTAPRLHIGHIIPFIKMLQLQKMGHEIIFLIGDFTGRIGDPTDKSAARRKLTDDEVKTNCDAFVTQIKRIFNFDDPVNPPLIKYNSTWNSKLSFADVIELASNFTVQQMIERDMFQKRLIEKKPIYLHEFLYPLIQGYDSVAMEVDGEFGGTDQTFNMLAGRVLLKSYKNLNKFVLTTKLLLSNDGVTKMSKSIGNCIFLNDTPEEKYGKIMAIPDSLLIHYYELLSDFNDEELKALSNRVAHNDDPMGIKKELAAIVVTMLDGKATADLAAQNFAKTVQNKERPDDIPQIERGVLIDKLANLSNEENITAKDVLTAAGITKSNSEAKRLIQEGAVEFDGKKLSNPNSEVDIQKLEIIKSGKRNWMQIIN